MAGKLIIARHHESEWNKLGLWTGLTDVGLSAYGREKSCEMGFLIEDIRVDRAFTSAQKRSIETYNCMLDTLGRSGVPVEHAKALNERDYGEYTGLNKWDMQAKVGKEEFDRIRREWDHAVPRGETLKMVYERAVPYYLHTIVPVLASGKNVLIVSHGNTIRALMKYIERIPDEGVKKLEMLFGGVIIYDVDGEGRMTAKEERRVHSKVNA